MKSKFNFLLSTFLFLSAFVFGQKVGGDRDAHGCIGSAGYTYSILKNDCIRIFEQEIKLLGTNETIGVGSQTAVVFSNDKKKAEVFLIFTDTKILIRAGKKGNYIWKKGDLTLSMKNKKYTLQKAGVVIGAEK